ncbi:hypothetical protein VZT92_016275 [Zoarces viviparus]|uniref:Uncharacterized protein n=1 Tax=Zoarces viviparus TaxID=48416 RepID=A0AAW1ESK7_ZOAVI
MHHHEETMHYTGRGVVVKTTLTLAWLVPGPLFTDDGKTLIVSSSVVFMQSPSNQIVTRDWDAMSLK